MNAKDNDGKTLAHSEAERENDDMIKYLVEKGADVNAIDNDGKTLAHFAAERGNGDKIGRAHV